MTLEKYPSKIKIQAIVACVIGVISLIFCALTQFTRSVNFLLDDEKMQMCLVIVAVFLAVFQYIYIRTIMKKRLEKATYSTFEERIGIYYRENVLAYWISVLALCLMSVIGLFVDNTLLVGLVALMLVFSIMILNPDPCRMKIDLGLSDEEVAKVYGENRDKTKQK